MRIGLIIICHHQEAKLKEARAKEKELLSDSGESEDEDNGMWPLLYNIYSNDNEDNGRWPLLYNIITDEQEAMIMKIMVCDQMQQQ